MALSDDEYTQLQTILQGLDGEIGRLNERSAQFVRDQIKREKQWGQDIFLSPRQWDWLKSLYEDKIGVLQGRQAAPMSDREADIDDEIPF